MQESAATQPTSPADLFRTFQRLALQGFGGVLPVAQRELVERKGWLTRGEFLELLSLAQVLPGPNIVNLALAFGDRCFGWRGAAAAMGGLMLAPLLLMLGLTVAYAGVAQHPVAAGALRGVGAVAAGLVLATALKLGSSLREHPLGRNIGVTYAVAAAVMVGALRWPLVAVVIGMGALGIAHVTMVLRRR